MSDDVYVKGHYRKGKWIEGHYKTRPEKGNPGKNYSYPGNYNPYTREYAPGTSDSYLYNNYEKERSLNTRVFLPGVYIKKDELKPTPFSLPKESSLAEKKNKYVEDSLCFLCGITIGKNFVKKLLGKTYCGLCISEARHIRRQKLLGNDIKVKKIINEQICNKCRSDINIKKGGKYLGKIYCDSCAKIVEEKINADNAVKAKINAEKKAVIAVEKAKAIEAEKARIADEKANLLKEERKKKNKLAREKMKIKREALVYQCESCGARLKYLEVKKLIGKTYCNICIREARSTRKNNLAKRKGIKYNPKK